VHSPELSSKLVSTLKSTAPTWALRSSAIDEAERVVQALAPQRPAVLAGSEATKQALVTAARSIRADGDGPAGSLPAREPVGPTGALHVAAPFRVNSAGPLFSPLLLAEGGGEGEGAPQPELLVRELFTLEPLASTVMFSDPATLSKRDAAMSVGPVDWAWRANGASTLILRRWGGDDVSATAIIGRFYEGLQAGKSPVEALESARASVRRTENGRAPAAWAGWIILTGR
jgi:hypothetical protein